MITGKLRQDVDRLWEEFWTGGITNPLTVIEQISFLMFSRMLDLREGLNQRKAKRLKGKPNPVPRLRLGPGNWKNLIKIRSRYSNGTPGPRSLTRHSAMCRPSDHATETSIAASFGLK